MRFAHEEVSDVCSYRYGPWWPLLSEHDRQAIVRAIVGGMPELTELIMRRRITGAAWAAADEFVAAIVTAPRMTGVLQDD